MMGSGGCVVKISPEINHQDKADQKRKLGKQWKSTSIIQDCIVSALMILTRRLINLKFCRINGKVHKVKRERPNCRLMVRMNTVMMKGGRGQDGIRKYTCLDTARCLTATHSQSTPQRLSSPESISVGNRERMGVQTESENSPRSSQRSGVP